MRKWFSLTAGCFVMVLLFMQIYCKENKSVADNKTYASLDSNTTYVGMQTCKGCHPDIYDTYVKTGMGKSIDVASRSKSSADFTNHPRIYDKFSDFYYQPYWKGDSLVFDEFRLSGKDTISKRQETISYIIGSGQHTNSHIYNVNGYLHQAPMTYYTQEGRWDLPPGFENGNNTRFSRIIGLECLSCHNGYPKLELGSENKYQFVPDGIDCERCHGPGSKHVQEKQSGKLLDISKEIDYSIVNPAKLSIDLQLDVCQRCHIQGNAVLNEGKSFYDFKPGMKLSDVMNVFMPVYEGNTEEHIMASHAERMKQSKCYISTTAAIAKDENRNKELKPYKNALTCVTCHNPHVSRLETSADQFNAACNNCHTTGKTLCKESEIARLKVLNNCVKCHMPENGAIDIPHVRVHDHKIKIPVDEVTVNKIKKFAGITAINNTSPSSASKAEAYLNYFEKFSMGREMLDSALKYLPAQSNADIKQNFRLLIRCYFLMNDYNRLLSVVAAYGDPLQLLHTKGYSNSDAWTCYWIGEAYKITGNRVLAEKYYQRCYELAPLDPSFTNEYGEALASNGKNEEAMKMFKLVNEMHPDFAPAYCNLGYLYLSVYRDTQTAEKLYNQSLALNPDYITALLNKAALYMINQNNKEAINNLKKVIKLEPSNQKAVMALKQLEHSL